MLSQKSSFSWRLTCLSCNSSLSVYISRGPALYSKQDLRSHIFLFLFLVSHINRVCPYIPEGPCLCRRMLCTVCYDLPPRDLCGHSPPLKIEPLCGLTCDTLEHLLTECLIFLHFQHRFLFLSNHILISALPPELISMAYIPICSLTALSPSGTWL